MRGEESGRREVAGFIALVGTGLLGAVAMASLAFAMVVTA